MFHRTGSTQAQAGLSDKSFRQGVAPHFADSFMPALFAAPARALWSEHFHSGAQESGRKAFAFARVFFLCAQTLAGSPMGCAGSREVSSKADVPPAGLGCCCGFSQFAARGACQGAAVNGHGHSFAASLAILQKTPEKLRKDRPTCYAATVLDGSPSVAVYHRMTSSLLMTSKCSAYLLNIFLYLCGVFFLALCTPLHFNVRSKLAI